MSLRWWAAPLVASLGWSQAIPPEAHRAIETIQANSLKGHVSFLASDLLEGRGSPSRGLDIAAEYIASQFRAAGLEPLGDDGYFQTMRWRGVSAPPEFKVYAGGTRIPNETIRSNFLAAKAEGELVGPDAAEVAGKIVRMEMTSPGAFSKRFASWQANPPAAVIVLDEKDVLGQLLKPLILVDPEKGRAASIPLIAVRDPLSIRTIREAATAKIEIGPPAEKEATLRNVAGVLRGSDPVLSRTAVIVSAHYDHEGLTGAATGDQVFNGANDNASGTAVVIDLARAFASLPVRPARSIIFLAVAAEEKGLWGSDYYVRHPLWPLKDTIANLNFEMFGRTGDGEMEKPGQATMTGAGYSNMTDVVRAAAEAAGARFFVNTAGNDEFFQRSDNFPFAKAGIPAHTFTPGFSFADYHQPGDEWQKLDYENMERAARIAGLAVYKLASDAPPPAWDTTNEKARKFSITQ